jgi:hypothetical protein
MIGKAISLALDAAGNLYLADGNNNRIRGLRARLGLIGTLAGQSITGFSGDNGAALNALFWDPVPSAVNGGGDIYIADYENSRIRRIVASTGIVTTFAGSGVC